MPTADEQVIVDGQRGMAVKQVSGDFIYDGGATDPYCIVNDNGTAQRALKVANIGEGGGGGGTVDQTYDPASTNAQSGTAVAEAVAPALKNTATGQNSLTILGTPATDISSLNIGEGSQAGQYSTAIGKGTYARGRRSVSLGTGTNDYYNERCTLVGYNSQAEANYAIAIGAGTSATAEGAIQIGNTSSTLLTNSNAKTLQVYEYQLLDGNTGLIPPERIGTGYDATKTQVLKHVNGVLTWVDEA